MYYIYTHDNDDIYIYIYLLLLYIYKSRRICIKMSWNSIISLAKQPTCAL